MATDVAQQPIDFGKLCGDLEIQELESPCGIASPQVYGQLLGIYLLQNELCHAKFLWKRIPQSVKNANPELSQIWSVGQKLWQRDFPGAYEVLKKDWTEVYKPIMTAVLECTRQGAFNLIGRAYSSIKADEIAAFVGLPVADALQAATAEGWVADPQTRIVTPKKPVPPAEPPLPNEQHLSVLTDYVSFMES
ncbi:hypothetical protein ACJMK2_013651 [Sinanodonta woodiana]|uniref:CSN8/PSMD8/EIF3K domain-containing protein n=1 Tax=Sinanodonta woodiana TaxID=1069815 RepID=A0ABD3V1F2_SINWO